jgi:hypothetical protein
MNKSRIFSAILAFLLLPSFALAQGYTVPGSERARPRSLVDHSRTDRLTGNPNPISMPGYCPSGQVFSGGSCVLISNQAAPYEPAWTSFFLGQRKCTSMGCATIQQDGSVYWQVSATYTPSRTSPTPVALSSVLQTWACGWGVHDLHFEAWPTGYNALTGTRPIDWAIREYSSSGTCN